MGLFREFFLIAAGGFIGPVSVRCSADLSGCCSRTSSP